MKKKITIGVLVSMLSFFFTITKVDAITFSQYLIDKANGKEKNYSEGTKTEMYTFNHNVTDQTGALIDYRYIGNTPNNYVKFNCKDDNSTNCEVWRIIGVFKVNDGKGKFEYRVKLIKDSGIGNFSWNSSNTNQWETSSLKSQLNDEEAEDSYYKSLSNTAKSMIGDTIYYLGGSKVNTGTAEEHYESERGKETCVTTNTCGTQTREDNWTGQIALMYPSDYIYTYALGVNEKCFNDIANCSTTGGSDSSAGWIYNSNNNESSASQTMQWTLQQQSNSTNYAFYISANGIYKSGLYSVSYTLGVRPVAYLTSDIYLEDGNGSKNDPYQLTLINPEAEVVFNGESIETVKKGTILGEIESLQDIINAEDFLGFKVNGEFVSKSELNTYEITEDIELEAVYAEKTSPEDNKVTTPETGDNVGLYIVTLLVSLFGLASIGLFLSKKKLVKNS